MQCPRRCENPINWNPEYDKWGIDDCCSYCGSLNPDILLDILLTEKVELVPTDKNYKVYVQAISDSLPLFKKEYRKCPDSCKDGPDICEHWVVEPSKRAKFYFMHFSVEQQKEFVRLSNEKKLSIASPGYFYVPPFFCVKVPK